MSKNSLQKSKQDEIKQEALRQEFLQSFIQDPNLKHYNFTEDEIVQLSKEIRNTELGKKQNFFGRHMDILESMSILRTAGEEAKSIKEAIKKIHHDYNEEIIVGDVKTRNLKWSDTNQGDHPAPAKESNLQKYNRKERNMFKDLMQEVRQSEIRKEKSASGVGNVKMLINESEQKPQGDAAVKFKGLTQEKRIRKLQEVPTPSSSKAANHFNRFQKNNVDSVPTLKKSAQQDGLEISQDFDNTSTLKLKFKEGNCSLDFERNKILKSDDTNEQFEGIMSSNNLSMSINNESMLLDNENRQAENRSSLIRKYPSKGKNQKDSRSTLNIKSSLNNKSTNFNSLNKTLSKNTINNSVLFKKSRPVSALTNFSVPVTNKSQNVTNNRPLSYKYSKNSKNNLSINKNNFSNNSLLELSFENEEDQNLNQLNRNSSNKEKTKFNVLLSKNESNKSIKLENQKQNKQNNQLSVSYNDQMVNPIEDDEVIQDEMQVDDEFAKRELLRNRVEHDNILKSKNTKMFNNLKKIQLKVKENVSKKKFSMLDPETERTGYIIDNMCHNEKYCEEFNLDLQVDEFKDRLLKILYEDSSYDKPYEFPFKLIQNESLSFQNLKSTNAKDVKLINLVEFNKYYTEKNSQIQEYTELKDFGEDMLNKILTLKSDIKMQTSMESSLEFLNLNEEKYELKRKNTIESTEERLSPQNKLKKEQLWSQDNIVMMKSPLQGQGKHEVLQVVLKKENDDDFVRQINTDMVMDLLGQTLTLSAFMMQNMEVLVYNKVKHLPKFMPDYGKDKTEIQRKRELDAEKLFKKRTVKIEEAISKCNKLKSTLNHTFDAQVVRQKKDFRQNFVDRVRYFQSVMNHENFLKVDQTMDMAFKQFEHMKAQLTEQRHNLTIRQQSVQQACLEQVRRKADQRECQGLLFQNDTIADFKRLLNFLHLLKGLFSHGIIFSKHILDFMVSTIPRDLRKREAKLQRGILRIISMLVDVC